MTENEFIQRYTSHLSAQQKQAVTATEGAVLLLAVPGSGKTTVLITRLGYMIYCRGIAPSEILAVTYTRAATFELKKRFSAFFGSEYAGSLEIRTINGLSSKIIERYGSMHGAESIPKLMSREGDRKRLISDIYKDITGEFADPSAINDVGAMITYAKNMMLTDEQISELDCGVADTLKIYKKYCSELAVRGLMDYDDQMVTALDILTKCPDILDYYHGHFHYICVDEAQDTSKIQHEIIRVLAKGSGNIFMVGDEDQSIYAFRGAYPDALTDFEKTYENASVLFMERNFRSTPEIIGAANAFVSRNRFRRDKTICAVNEAGMPVRTVHCRGRATQYDFLCGVAKRNEMQTAALFRNNDSAVALVDMLERSGIGYRLKGGEKTFFTSKPVTDIVSIINFINDPYNVDEFMRIYYKIGLYINKQAAQTACRISAARHIPITDALLGPGEPTVGGGIELTESSRKNIIRMAEYAAQARSAGASETLSIIWRTMQYSDYVHKNNLDGGKYDILRLLARNVSNGEQLTARLGELSEIMATHTDDPDSLFTMSTIHSSKGLEYDRVYLLDVINNVLPSITSDKLDDKEDVKQYEEERRLFYVAMTRARKELYLFSCTGESSEFVSEVDRDIPIEYTDSNDIFFSLFARDMLGREYCDRENGKGVVTAYCNDKLYIRYASGKSELKTLEEMLKDRDRTAHYITKEELDKLNTNDSAKADIVPSKRVVMPKEGDKLYHGVFGNGVIRSIDKLGIGTVYFEASGQTKRLMLETCVKNGIIKV